VRIGILGGSFDPPHVGHLLAANDAVEALALDRLLFIPAAEQPLKAGLASAPANHRLAMVRLLAGRDPRFGVDSIEIDRGGLSYTVDTLRALRDRWRESAPLALFLLIGADVAATLPKWREPEAIAALAELVMLTREGGAEGLPPLVSRRLRTRRVDVSSTEVRARTRAGKSIRGFVPDAVAEYIATTGLYQ
jgi:nicotinate-nucleotide adenylyltransferase